MLKRVTSYFAALAALMMAIATHASAGGQGPPAAKAPVVVFAAASLKTALDRIGTIWREEKGTAITVSYAASSALAKQIEQGAPADLFASADLKWMDYLAEKALIAPDTRKELLGNTLVLIAPADSTATLKIEPNFPLAEAIGEGRLATGDPKSVPAGAYAEAALTSLGVWERVKPRLAGTENVRAALAFVARKEAPFGIVYGSDAKSEPRVKVLDVFPESAHPPIVYPFAVTASSQNAAARDFLAFLSTDKAKQVFIAEGFTVK